METELAAGGSTTAVWIVLAAVPLVLVLATAFTKASVVLGGLRLGLGAEAILPLPVMLALALVVTGIVMAPVAAEVLELVEAAGGPPGLVDRSWVEWLELAAPLQRFVEQNADPQEVEFFAELQQAEPTSPVVLVSAFLVTELTEALAMAVVIIVPLVLVDLLVAQALVLIGLVNQPTPIVTVPLKLLLFLTVGGWDIVIGGLVSGYS